MSTEGGHQCQIATGFLLRVQAALLESGTSRIRRKPSSHWFRTLEALPVPEHWNLPMLNFIRIGACLLTLSAPSFAANWEVMDDGQTTPVAAVSSASTYRFHNGGQDNNVTIVVKDENGAITGWFNCLTETTLTSVSGLAEVLRSTTETTADLTRARRCQTTATLSVPGERSLCSDQVVRN